MPTRPYVIDEMISAKSIAARIEELCRDIQSKFADTDKLVVVGLLRGSFVFIADLVRELDLPIEGLELWQRHREQQRSTDSQGLARRH